FGIIAATLTYDRENLVGFASRSTQMDVTFPDGNNQPDMFVHDITGPSSVRVNYGPGNTEADASSGFSVPSVRKNWVAYASDATTLGPAANTVTDVFVSPTVPLPSGATRMSENSAGAPGSAPSAPAGVPFGQNVAMSADGRFVVFPSLADNLDIP